MAGIEVRVDLSEFTRTMDALAHQVADFGIPMRVAADQYRLRHGQAWDNMKYSMLNTGSVTFRGEVGWTSTTDQYTRKTDNVTVPPWGGVKKVRGRGNVKGRKRPSGQRVKSNDVMMIDTARMRNSFLASPKYENNGNRVIFDASHVEYAGVQNARRPFVFFADVDVQNFRDECVKYLKVLMARLSRRT